MSVILNWDIPAIPLSYRLEEKDRDRDTRTPIYTHIIEAYLPLHWYARRRLAIHDSKSTRNFLMLALHFIPKRLLPSDKR